MMLATAAEYNLERWKLDYNTQFTKHRYRRGSVCQDGTRIGEMRRKQSPTGNEGLKKSTPWYGLCQTPTNWCNTIIKHLMEISCKRLEWDPCIYTCYKCGATYILTLYVDIFLLLGMSRC